MVVGDDGRLPLPWLRAPLQQALDRRAHALLLQAASGIGGLEFMLALAQAWLCEVDGGAAGRPCGRCESCRLVRARTHPDLLVVLPEALREALGWAGQCEEDASAAGAAKGRRKPSRQIRIDEVRQAIDWATQSSSRGRAKVVLVHPAEAMNLQAASALLKTLEEPPGEARLVLGTRDEALLLPTVRSRCQRIRLATPPPGEALAWLQGQGVRDAEVLLAAAGGGPLAALDMAGAGVDGASWSALPSAVRAGQATVLAGWSVPLALDALQKLCHDALRASLGLAPRYFPARSVPAGASLQALAAWSRSLARVARHDEHAWNEGLLIEALVAEAGSCWQEATTRRGRETRGFDTLAS